MRSFTDRRHYIEGTILNVVHPKWRTNLNSRKNGFPRQITWYHRWVSCRGWIVLSNQKDFRFEICKQISSLPEIKLLLPYPRLHISCWEEPSRSGQQISGLKSHTLWPPSPSSRALLAQKCESQVPQHPYSQSLHQKSDSQPKYKQKSDYWHIRRPTKTRSNKRNWELPFVYLPSCQVQH